MDNNILFTNSFIYRNILKYINKENIFKNNCVLNIQPYIDTFELIMVKLDKYKNSVYSSVLNEFNIEITEEIATNLFIDYIIPATFKANTGSIDKSMLIYMSLFDRLMEIQNIVDNINKESNGLIKKLNITKGIA